MTNPKKGKQYEQGKIQKQMEDSKSERQNDIDELKPDKNMTTLQERNYQT